MFVLIAIFYLSATSNAVNLTDGMDGLAAGCVGMVSLVLAVLCYVASETMGPITSDDLGQLSAAAAYTQGRRTKRLLFGNLGRGAGLSVVQLSSCSGFYGRCRLTGVRSGDGLWGW